ncbi:hypothetical protein KPATCC21470_4447 [Kitasatospora purpeofusca]
MVALRLTAPVAYYSASPTWPDQVDRMYETTTRRLRTGVGNSAYGRARAWARARRSTGTAD